MSWCFRTALKFCAGGLLSVGAMYGLSEAVDPVYPEMRGRAALFLDRMTTLQAVAVGNSHGAAIEFDALGVTGFNFSMAGQDGFEGIHLARYATEATQLQFVLFAASYGLQRKDHSVVVGEIDLRSRRRQMYAATRLQRPLAGEERLWLGGMLAPLVRDDHWKGVLASPVYQRAPIRLRNDGRKIAATPAPLTPDALARHGAQVGAQHAELGAQLIEAAPDTPDRLTAMLDALAGELGTRGVTLVLYTPPYHESYLLAQDPRVVAEMHRILQLIVARNQNAVFLDYAADPRFAHRNELFTNSDHLNRDGGRAFSGLLRECLTTVFSGKSPAAAMLGCPAQPLRVATAGRRTKVAPDRVDFLAKEPK